MTDYFEQVLFDCDFIDVFGFLGFSDDVKARLYRDENGDFAVFIENAGIDIGRFGPFSEEAIRQIVAGSKLQKSITQIMADLHNAIQSLHLFKIE